MNNVKANFMAKAAPSPLFSSSFAPNNSVSADPQKFSEILKRHKRSIHNYGDRKPISASSVLGAFKEYLKEKLGTRPVWLDQGVKSEADDRAADLDWYLASDKHSDFLDFSDDNELNDAIAKSLRLYNEDKGESVRSDDRRAIASALSIAFLQPEVRAQMMAKLSDRQQAIYYDGAVFHGLKGLSLTEARDKIIAILVDILKPHDYSPRVAQFLARELVRKFPEFSLNNLPSNIFIGTENWALYRLGLDVAKNEGNDVAALTAESVLEKGKLTLKASAQAIGGTPGSGVVWSALEPGSPNTGNAALSPVAEKMLLWLSASHGRLDLSNLRAIPHSSVSGSGVPPTASVSGSGVPPTAGDDLKTIFTEVGNEVYADDLKIIGLIAKMALMAKSPPHRSQAVGGTPEPETEAVGGTPEPGGRAVGGTPPAASQAGDYVKRFNDYNHQFSQAVQDLFNAQMKKAPDWFQKAAQKPQGITVISPVAKAWYNMPSGRHQYTSKYNWLVDRPFMPCLFMVKDGANKERYAIFKPNSPRLEILPKGTNIVDYIKNNFETFCTKQWQDSKGEAILDQEPEPSFSGLFTNRPQGSNFVGFDYAGFVSTPGLNLDGTGGLKQLLYNKVHEEIAPAYEQSGAEKFGSELWGVVHQLLRMIPGVSEIEDAAKGDWTKVGLDIVNDSITGLTLLGGAALKGLGGGFDVLEAGFYDFKNGNPLDLEALGQPMTYSFDELIPTNLQEKLAQPLLPGQNPTMVEGVGLKGNQLIDLWLPSDLDPGSGVPPTAPKVRPPIAPKPGSGVPSTAPKPSSGVPPPIAPKPGSGAGLNLTRFEPTAAEIDMFGVKDGLSSLSAIPTDPQTGLIKMPGANAHGHYISVKFGQQTKFFAVEFDDAKWDPAQPKSPQKGWRMVSENGAKQGNYLRYENGQWMRARMLSGVGGAPSKVPNYSIKGNGPGGMWPAGQENINRWLTTPPDTESLAVTRAIKRAWFTRTVPRTYLLPPYDLPPPAYEPLQGLLDEEDLLPGPSSPRPPDEPFLASLRGWGAISPDEFTGYNEFIGVTTDERIRTLDAVFGDDYHKVLQAQKRFLKHQILILDKMRVINSYLSGDDGWMIEYLDDAFWRLNLVRDALKNLSLDNTVIGGYNNKPNALVKSIYGINKKSLPLEGAAPVYTAQGESILSIGDFSSEPRQHYVILMDGVYFEIIHPETDPSIWQITLPAEEPVNGDYSRLLGPKVRWEPGSPGHWTIGPMTEEAPF